MTFSPSPADRVPNLSSDFKYKVLKTGTGVSIRKFLVPNATAVVIPNEIDGLPVVEIGPRAFENRDSLTSVALPSQLATVGERAFYSCSSLTKVDFFTIPKFGKEAFYACEALTTVALPVDAETLRTAGFELSLNRPFYEIFDSCVVFSVDGKTLIKTCRQRNAKYVVPDGVEAIADYAFAHCHTLTNVAHPNSLRRIGVEAFAFCAEPKKIAIPDGLETVGPWAFLGGRTLRTLRFGAALREIGPNAFEKCSSSLTLSAPKGSVVEQYAKENNRRFRPRRR
ncbi:MAG: leucine-rich repeat domain-containing protein [Thermoguttaceae bacterium]|nr:leucine-rich repeat domain-containing protein [Thermoguttaceae bacterium]